MITRYRNFWLMLFHSILTVSVQADNRNIISDNHYSYSISESFYSDTLPTQWKPSFSPFVELMGKGFISVNIDYRPSPKYAVSFGIQPTEGILPDLMYYRFFGNRHRFETGAGFSIGIDNHYSLACMLFHGTVGYRYQKKKGVFFRAGFTPLVTCMFNDETTWKFYPFAGLSLGYSF